MKSNAPKRTSKNTWIESIDPLANISIAESKAIYNAARRFGSPRLHKIYEEIEATDPILMTCIERRAAALSGLGHRIIAKPGAENADAQIAALEDFVNNITNLSDAIEHLDSAFFRGYAVTQPIWAKDNSVNIIELFDSWNFLRDHNDLYWNPTCTQDINGCELITPAHRAVALLRRRAIDWPALAIYLRKYIGERDWGRFLERYGIPPVDAIMAANATEKDEAKYNEATQAAGDGLSVTWPNGTTLSRAEGARGQDPFSAFIRHNEELIVLMATGGTLTSLAQADSGSLAGGAQMDVWREIVKHDSTVISSALNQQLFEQFLAKEFPGEPILAKFEIGPEERPSPKEVLDLATKAKTSGYLIAQEELEEKTGYKLVKDDAQTSFQGGLNAFANKLKNKRLSPDARPSEGEQSADLLAAFASDMSPVGKAINELIENPSPEAAADLIDRLPSLLPDDPAMAAILAEAMAKEFGSGPAPSAASDGNEITQEVAEKIYEEMMSK